MKNSKRRVRTAQRPQLEALPIQPLYQVSQLARATGLTHRQFQRLLKMEEVQVFRVGRFLLVPLSELEEKVGLVWESIKVAASLRRALGDT